ncbi:carbohydrate kinase family protein [Salinarimonas chemoclinalis]|uniref:carbohydrate kinase family protein n=1 Tax=Salinarimonas chemoclinalis TaxID=3241599 RepID=UPI0035580203
MSETENAFADGVLVVGNNIADEVLVVDGLALDEKVFCEEWSLHAGGQAANAAATLARLRVPTRFLGRFGDDEAGRFTRAAMAADGIDTRASPTLPARTIAASVIVDRASGQRTIVMRRDPALLAAPLPTGEDLLAGVAVLYGDGYERDAFTRLAALARARGLAVVCDLETRDPEDARLLDLVTDLIAPAAVLCAMAGTDEPEDAVRTLAARGPRVVVATMGPAGAIGAEGERIVRTPAAPCTVVDTTGAGDAFHAGYVAALLEGLDLAGRMARAAAVAAVKCGHPGPQAPAAALALLATRRSA